jgi:hypothetical protein
MSMSTHVVGIKPPDEKWKKMKAVYDACEAAGVSPPPEVGGFFGHEAPDKLGVMVSQKDLGNALREWRDDTCMGYEVDLTKLTPDIKVLRFYNSW